MAFDLIRREPLDPDTGGTWRLRPAVLVGLGGAIGTTARYLIAEVMPEAFGIPLGILAVNLVGAFLLGLLLEYLARLGPDIGRRRDVRFFCGTGILGGFTTYSTLAVGAAGFIQDGRVGVGIGYGIATVLLGGLCTTGGIRVAATAARGERR